MILESQSPTPAPTYPVTLPVSVQFARFRGKDGVEEFQCIIRPTEYAHFDIQLKWVEQAYEQALARMGVERDTAVWRRFLCSDLINQVESLRSTPFSNPELPTDSPCAISWVKQAPAPPSKVSLWAYHMVDSTESLRKSASPHTLSLQRGPLTHHWTTGLACSNEEDSHAQTHGIFKQYGEFLEEHGLSLFDNVMRTWFFVQNVDTNYAGLVEARNEVFDENNLTSKTHYIASTGIEGGYVDAPTKAVMDAYAVSGIQADQIHYLRALDYLSPTNIYGVAFERATAISYRDRKHIFISGTASIDSKGVTLYRGDIDRQLDRTLMNIEALLQEAGATLDDMQVMIVYLRDSHDEEVVRDRLNERFSDTPYEIVTAPVCRPGWLIEIEGLAALENEAPALPAF